MTYRPASSLINIEKSIMEKMQLTVNNLILIHLIYELNNL